MRPPAWAAVCITDFLQPRPDHHAGQRVQIFTTWNPEGWVVVSGRVVSDGTADCPDRDQPPCRPSGVRTHRFDLALEVLGGENERYTDANRR